MNKKSASNYNFVNYRNDFGVLKLNGKKNKQSSFVKNYGSNLTLSYAHIKDANLGYKLGEYYTIDSTSYATDSNCYNKTIELLANSIYKLAKCFNSIILIGIGNRGLVSDSLGPITVNKINVDEFKSIKLFKLVPDVVGNTNIESTLIIQSIINAVRPDLVFIIDSLCTKNIDRIGTSFQLTNSSIVPGSGVNNAKIELNKSSLGTNVIALGVPMVYKLDDAYAFLKIDCSNSMNLVVSLKEVDYIVEECSNIISKAIKKAFTKIKQSI